jgi:hypothetical protein
MRISLGVRMVPLLRTLRWLRIAAAVQRVETALFGAAAGMLRLPAAGHTAAGDAARAQVALPVRHGGMGFRPVNSREAGVAYLAGAVIAAMAAGAACLRSFSAPLRVGVEASWLAAGAAVGDAWPASWRNFKDAVVRDVLLRTPCDFSRLVDDRAAFLARFNVATEAGRRDAARVRSCACRAESI